jgi:putative DNA-invertase from lambdoid prophage Rac
MVFTVIAAVAELERSLICERVAMSLQRAKAQGKRLGRSAVKIYPAEVQGLREQGTSFRAIARQVTPL